MTESLPMGYGHRKNYTHRSNNRYLINPIDFRQIRHRMIKKTISYIFVEKQLDNDIQGICTFVLNHGDWFNQGDMYFSRIEKWINNKELRICEGFDIYRDNRFVLVPGRIKMLDADGNEMWIEYESIPSGMMLRNGRLLVRTVDGE